MQSPNLAAAHSVIASSWHLLPARLCVIYKEDGLTSQLLSSASSPASFFQPLSFQAFAFYILFTPPIINTSLTEVVLDNLS